MRTIKENVSEFKDNIIYINRVAKVVKGGRRFSFSTLVVVGDKNGTIGIGKGKANSVPQSISKAIETAKRNLMSFPLNKTTIPHPVIGKFGSTRVVLRPASEGTGVIAGGAVRTILESAGVKNILSKILGSKKPVNVAYATIEGLSKLLYAALISSIVSIAKYLSTNPMPVDLPNGDHKP